MMICSRAREVKIMGEGLLSRSRCRDWVVDVQASLTLLIHKRYHLPSPFYLFLPEFLRIPFLAYGSRCA